MPIVKKDASVQAVLCSCSSVDTEPLNGTRDACEQAALCHCSEFVTGVNSAVSLDSGIGATLDATGTSNSPPDQSHVPITVASDRGIATNVNKKEVVDIEEIDAICKEMAECDLEDTVLYDYECGNLHPVGGNGDAASDRNVAEADGAKVVHSSADVCLNDCRKNNCNVSSAVSVSEKFSDDILESARGIATVCEPDDSSDDSFIVSMHSVSLQTSAVEIEKGVNIGVGHPHDADSVRGPLTSFDKTTQSSMTSSAACLLPPLLNGDTAEMDRSSSDPIFDSCKKGGTVVSSDDVLRPGCAIAIVCEPSANSSDNVVNVHSVSLATSAVDKVLEVGAGHKPDADAVNAPLPSFHGRVESSEASSAACSLPPQPGDDRARVNRSSANLFSDSNKKSSCDTSLDTSVNAEVIDEVFESGPGPAAKHSFTKFGRMLHKPTFPGLDNELEQEMDVHTLGVEADLPSDESVGEIVHHQSSTSPDDETCATRKVLSSTAIGSPAAIDEFFGLSGSSLSGGSEPSPKWSVASGRRKSKPGRRVSMCGEYEGGSPTQFFTPHRSTVTATSHLTVIADTDEDDDSMAHKSIFYTTAVDGHLVDTVSESDDESVKPAIEECIPDSPIAANGPSPDKLSIGESEQCLSSESSEHISPKPAGDGHSIDGIPSENCRISQHRSVDRGVDGHSSSGHAESIEHLHSKPLMLVESERNLGEELENCVPLDAADDKNRYHCCQRFSQICLTFLPRPLLVG